MSDLLKETIQALILIVRGDPEVWQITFTSLSVSITALILAMTIAVPVASALASSRRGVARFGSWLLHTFTAVPTVAIGLGLYFALSASGPLGWMDLLYTKAAMIAGQTLLAAPIIGALVLTDLRRLPAAARETAFTLAIPRFRRTVLLLRELGPAWVSTTMLAFARVFTEVGAAIILGGNIRGETRVLTTVIALEHNRGDDARAIALGLILIGIALSVNGAAQIWQMGRET
ncbi:MAG: ABC transporter permease [Thermoanaerobaculia bacterium]|nr:ABC transporter permease [Thermoanaerobaculia bacterium]